jgi:hypothetical protein
MTPTIRPVRTQAERKAFVDFPYRHYAGVQQWVPPLRMDQMKTLDPKKNPFFEHGAIQPFLAERGGEIVGTIAAIVNGMHLEKYDDATGFFGFFETVDDYAVAEALFDAASDWLGRRSLRAVRGPVNPSMNDTAALLVDGFQFAPSILMPYNYAYYEGFVERYGFERAMTTWSYFVHYKYLRDAKLRRGVQLVKRRYPNLTTRTLDMSRFDEDARVVLDIYNEAWSENWGHVPMTDAEFAKLAADLKQIVDPELVVILEDEGEPVAFAISLPNLNQVLPHVKDGKLFQRGLPTGLAQLLLRSKLGAINEIRMPLMGVRKAYHGRGLDAFVILETIDNGIAHGYYACEMSWVLDENHRLRNALDALGGVADKQYALYEKVL